MNMNSKIIGRAASGGEKFVHPRVARALMMISSPITPATHTRDQLQPSHGEILRTRINWDQVI